MAGIANNPNSPRQKMINLMYLVFIAMMALNVSSEVLDGFELVEGSLRTSIDNTSTRNEIVTEELKAYYQTNPEKVREWYEKGTKVKQASDSLYNYVQDLKVRIAQIADGKDADYKENPTSYQIKKGIVTNKTKISVWEARSGGFALSLIEATPAEKKSVKKWK